MNALKELKLFIILLITQSLSSLGSAMTNFALVIWLYQASGSALETALLAVCSYLPYVLVSVFAGAISDKWNKKTTMLICDSFAAVCTVSTLILLKMNILAAWHLYVLNTLNGFMNSVQSPASDVASTLLTPRKYYQKTSGMRSFSTSLVSILTPVLSTVIIAFSGIEAVIMLDLLTFLVAFFVLLFFIKIPKIENNNAESETLMQAVKSGLAYMKNNIGILFLILFLSAINLVASVSSAALPALILSKRDNIALGVVNSSVGIATLLGSILAIFWPKPKSRIKTLCNCLLISMSTENFVLAFFDNVALWSVGAMLAWLPIPLMGANYDVIFRTNVPKELQGRVYSVRNAFQYFTIPVGYFLGGFLVDSVFEPMMANIQTENILSMIFGSGKGSGAAVLYLILGIAGVAVCLVFSNIKELKSLEEPENLHM